MRVRNKQGVGRKRQGNSSVILDVLDRIDDLVNEFQRNTGNNAFSISEGTLKSAESDTSLLGRDAREKLEHNRNIKMISILSPQQNGTLLDIPRQSREEPQNPTSLYLAIRLLVLLDALLDPQLDLRSRHRIRPKVL